MKTPFLTLAAVLAIPMTSRAQETFQYDQQSAVFPIGPNVVFDIQGNEPVGQSFTPALPAVGFVQFDLFDGHANNGVGATVYVNIRSNSITGPILASSVPVFLPDTPSGGGVTNFVFSGGAAVIPGRTYYFEIVVQSGDLWTVNSLGVNSYSGGAAYLQGAPQPEDFWFREGVVVPEPSAGILLVFGSATLALARLAKAMRSH